MPRLSRKKEKSKIIKKKNTKKITTKKSLKGGVGIKNITTTNPMYTENNKNYVELCNDLDGYKLNIKNIASTDILKINKLVGLARLSELDHEKIQKLLEDSDALENYKLLNNLQEKIDVLEPRCYGFKATNNNENNNEFTGFGNNN